MSLELGKTILQQILAKLPDATRATIAPVFEDASATEALTLLGTAAADKTTTAGILADLQKREGELQAYHGQLDTWYQSNKADLDAYAKIKANPNPNPNPPNPDPKPPSTGISKEEVETLLRQRDAEYAAVLGVTQPIALAHLQRFNEVLDVNAIIAHANTNRMTFADAYATVHKDKIDAANKAIEDKRIETLVQERLAAERKNNPQPFPLRTGTVEPSPLDQLAQKPEERSARYTADSAAARYEELVSNAGRAH